MMVRAADPDTQALTAAIFDDPAFSTDPYPFYAALRRAGPVLAGRPGVWVFTRHDDVAALLRDRRLGSEFPNRLHQVKLGSGPASGFFARIMIDRDGPAHTVLRGGFRPLFGPASNAALQDVVTQTLDDLLTPLLDRADFDLVDDLATPLPVLVICRLLGVPESDLELLRPPMVDLATAFGELTLTDTQQEATHAAVDCLRRYVSDLIDNDRTGPGLGMLAQLLAGTDLGHVDRAEVVDNVIFLLFAGFETTRSLIANGTVALLSRPDQWALLRRRPALRATAVEEFLRFDSPVQLSMRLVKQSFTAHGTTVRAGRMALLLLGSANHDDQRFNDPARLDIERHPNPHVAFGGGHHYCLGAPLARLEGAAVLRELTKRFTDLGLAGVPERRPHPSIRSFRHVRISAVPA